MKAYELIEKGFCKNYCAVDRVGERVDFDDRRAVAWCAMGAIWKVYGPLDALSLKEAFYKLKAKVGDSIGSWSDFATKETVISTLKELDI